MLAAKKIFERKIRPGRVEDKPNPQREKSGSANSGSGRPPWLMAARYGIIKPRSLHSSRFWRLFLISEPNFPFPERPRTAPPAGARIQKRRVPNRGHSFFAKRMSQIEAIRFPAPPGEASRGGKGGSYAPLGAGASLRGPLWGGEARPRPKRSSVTSSGVRTRANLTECKTAPLGLCSV